MTSVQPASTVTWACPRPDCITQLATVGGDGASDRVHAAAIAIADHERSHQGQPVDPIELTAGDRAIAAQMQAELDRIAGS